MNAKIRLYITNDLQDGELATLSPDQSHYLTRVMRMKEGQNILVFNGRDGEYLAEIISANKNNCTINLINKTKEQKQSPDIWLCFAPVKNAPLNFVIQKATELGASALWPVITKNTVVSRVNTERLKANAIEAAEQSRRLDVPEIFEPEKFKQLLSNWPEDRKIIFCDESGNGQPAKEALASLKKGKYAIFIGPEGGFSREEFEIIISKHYIIPICMGPRILRADTAAIAALTCVQNFLGDWDEKPKFE